MWRRLLLIFLIIFPTNYASPEDEIDGESSRKVLGSSVVTSVSVIMDTGNGTKAVFTDAVGKPVSKPITASDLASPIDLLNPDRYEFYTFDDSGDLVKRLMTLDEIQGIIATGDGDGFNLDSFTSQGFFPEKRVNDVVNNVQNVLKEEMESHKNSTDALKPLFDTPDVSDSWSMILPAVFGNSGEDIKPEKPIVHVTPDTIMIEPTTILPTRIEETPTTGSKFVTSSVKPVSVSATTQQISTTQKVMTLQTAATEKIVQKPLLGVTAGSTESAPTLDVEITTNSNSTTEKPFSSLSDKYSESPIVEIKPTTNNFEVTKDSFLITTEKTTTRAPTTISTTKVSTSKISTTTTGTTKIPSTLPVFSTQNFVPVRLSTTTKATTSTSPSTTTTTTTTKRTTTSTTPLTTTITTTPTTTTTSTTPSTTTITTTPTTTTTSTTPSTTTTPTTTTRTPSTTTTSTTTSSTTPFMILSSSSTPVSTTVAPTSSVEIFETSPSATTSPLTKQTSPQQENISKNPTSTLRISTQTPIITTTNSIQLTTTRKPEISLPTLFDIINSKPLADSHVAETITTEQIVSSTNKNNFDDNLITSSTFGPLSTFFIIDQHSKVTPESTTSEVFTTTSESTTRSQNKATETTIAAEKSTEFANIEKNQTKLSDNDDLSTLSTEYIALTSTNANRKPEPITERLPTAEILSQLLLTSTNIYEINSELSDNSFDQSTVISSVEDNRFDTSTVFDASTTTISPSLEALTTNKITTTVSAEETSQKNLMNIIHEIISQTVGTIEESVNENNNKTQNKIQEMLETANKTMPQIQLETATIASSLIGLNNDEVVNPTTTTEANIFQDLVTDSSLSSVVDSLIWQVSGSEKPNFTTLDDISIATTEAMVTTSNTTEEQYLSSTTTEFGTEQDSLDGDRTETISVIQTTDNTFDELNKNKTETNDFVPHIINITIIRNENRKNQSKPAKADLSLEVDYDENSDIFTKNISSQINQTSNKISDEILKTEATSSIHNDNAVDETTEEKNFTETTTYDDTEVLETTTNTIEFGMKIKNFTTTTSVPTTIKSKETTTPFSRITETRTSPTPSVVATTGKVFATTPTIITTTTKPTETPKPEIHIIINEKNQTNFQQNNKETDSAENNWTLVSTLSPHSESEVNKNLSKPTHVVPSTIVESPKPVDLIPKPLQGFGLEDSTSKLDTDVFQFAQLCNELAFGFWKSVTNGVSSARSIVVSPFAATSLLAMVFLGARGATSGEMNEILRLDDMVTFNPHLIFKNVSESIEVTSDSGVSASAIIRELYSDRSKGKLLNFYKERAKQFYDGHVEEASFRDIGDTIRRRTNLLVKKHTAGKILEFLKDSTLIVKPPLAGISASIFYTDCSQASSEGRDGELHFVVLPSIRQRRLIPIPAAVWRTGFLAGYEPSLDATAVSLGTKEQTVSTIFVIPGQQGIAAPGDGLARLEKRLVESSFKKGAWSRLLRSLIPRPGLELQIPRFLHRSVINATVSLKQMGLKDLFNANAADLRGLNGVSHELHLSDILQVNSFATCGEGRIGDTHHSEIYPISANNRNLRNLDNYQNDYGINLNNYNNLDEPRDYQRAFHDPLHDPSYLNLPLALRPRQARLPDAPRLRFDRPFLYFVRHNPTGLILHMGRFNPRLLP